MNDSASSSTELDEEKSLSGYIKFIDQLAKNREKRIYESLDPKITPAILKHIFQDLAESDTKRLRLFVTNLDKIISTDERSLISMLYRFVVKIPEKELFILFRNDVKKESKLYKFLSSLSCNKKYENRIKLRYFKKDKSIAKLFSKHFSYGNINNFITTESMFRIEYDSQHAQYSFHNREQPNILNESFDELFSEEDNLSTHEYTINNSRPSQLTFTKQ